MLLYGCVPLSMNQIFSFPLLNVENETNNLNVSVFQTFATEFQRNFYFRFRLEVFKWSFPLDRIQATMIFSYFLLILEIGQGSLQLFYFFQ